MNKLPSVYQIEVFSRCNLKCPFCLTGMANESPRYETSAMPLHLFRQIVERDLGNTQFVELQMRGEPTLHKELITMINLIKERDILVGFSTHGGTLLKNDRSFNAALLANYLTISLDAGTKQGYKLKRVGGHWENTINGISKLIATKGDDPFPIIDLQLIEEDSGHIPWQNELRALQQLIYDQHWEGHVHLRTIPNSNVQWKNPNQPIIAHKELCLNPWLSVSIKANGDVVPCCMAFKDEPEMTYGNVAKQSLEEIWDSDFVKAFRFRHTYSASNVDVDLPETCLNCTNRSPVLYHDTLIINGLKRQIKG